MRRLAILLAGLCAFSSAENATAQAQRYTIDSVHTQVLFSLSHLGFSRSMGRFQGIAGHFTYDPDDWSSARVEVEIPIGSLYLGDRAWERKILSDQYFDADRFPTARFVGTRLQRLDGPRGRLYGELTLHGVTRPVVLELTANRIGRHTYSLKYVAGFSAHTTIKRSDFGMSHLLPAVGDEVEIGLEVEGLRQRGDKSDDGDEPTHTQQKD
jgi:polyisoprenoid-binding protein YceI